MIKIAVVSLLFFSCGNVNELGKEQDRRKEAEETLDQTASDLELTRDAIKSLRKTSNYYWLLTGKDGNEQFEYTKAESLCEDMGFIIPSDIAIAEYRSVYYDPLSAKDKELFDLIISNGYHSTDEANTETMKACLCARAEEDVLTSE